MVTIRACLKPTQKDYNKIYALQVSMVNVYCTKLKFLREKRAPCWTRILFYRDIYALVSFLCMHNNLSTHIYTLYVSCLSRVCIVCGRLYIHGHLYSCSKSKCCWSLTVFTHAQSLILTLFCLCVCIIYFQFYNAL